MTRRDQGYALLQTLLPYQVPLWPERLLTRDDAAEIERLVRSRSCPKWLASEDFSETIGHLRTVIQIPGAAHCALEYQRWAARSQLRDEGRRFMRSMCQRLGVPLLHLRGEADPMCLPTRSIGRDVTRRRDATYPSRAQGISATKRPPRKSTGT